MKLKKPEYDHLGNRVYRGGDILEFIPEPVLPFVRIGAEDIGKVWEDIIEDCTLYVKDGNSCTLMYNVGQWVFSGQMLLTYCLNPEHDHRISPVNKGKHLDYVLKNF